MVKIDLITGFLGSGKTTLLKRYAQYLIRQGKQIGILENDYGAVNVDMMLLQDLPEEQCELEMISGGCDRETHRRRFRTKLIAMGMCGYDRILMEPSGIYDMDEFFDVLRDEPLDQWYEIGNVITVVDAVLEKNLSEEAEYLLASEAASAGRIVLSHTDLAEEAQIRKTMEFLNQALETIGCDRRLEEDRFIRGITNLTDADFAELCSCGYVTASYPKKEHAGEDGFQSVYLLDLKLSEKQIRTAILQIMEDQSCGEVFRIKGFTKDGDSWKQFNATRNQMTVSDVPAGQSVLIVIGEHLNEERIRSMISTIGQE